MIGSGLKKLAKENGMKVDQGVAYGNFRGYSTTFFEGAGWKAAVIVTRVDAEQLQTLDAALKDRDLTKEFRVQKLDLANNQIAVTFLDNPGTMKKMTAFFDWYIPLLDSVGASGAGTCCRCGTSADSWKLINGVAYPIHDACAVQLQQAADADLERAREEDTGTYGRGILGAALGAIVGAIPWAVVLYMGYVASALGILIGWCCKKGYELLHGKNGKAKIVIVLAMSLLGVALGSFAGDVLTLAVMILQGEIYGATLMDLPTLIGILFADPEYLEGLRSNLLQGGLYAILGLVVTFMQMKKEADVGKMTVKDLK